MASLLTVGATDGGGVFSRGSLSFSSCILLPGLGFSPLKGDYDNVH